MDSEEMSTGPPKGTRGTVPLGPGARGTIRFGRPERDAAVLDVLRSLAAGRTRFDVPVHVVAARVGIAHGDAARALIALSLAKHIRAEFPPNGTDPVTVDLAPSTAPREGEGERGEPTEGGEEVREGPLNTNTHNDAINVNDEIYISDNIDDDVGVTVAGGGCRGEGPAAAAATVLGGDVSPAAAPPPAPTPSADPARDLAVACASALKDLPNLNAYLALANRYAPDRLRDALDIALAVPLARVRRSRAALFTFLVKHGT